MHKDTFDKLLRKWVRSDSLCLAKEPLHNYVREFYWVLLVSNKISNFHFFPSLKCLLSVVLRKRKLLLQQQLWWTKTTTTTTTTTKTWNKEVLIMPFCVYHHCIDLLRCSRKCGPIPNRFRRERQMRQKKLCELKIINENKAVAHTREHKKLINAFR